MKLQVIQVGAMAYYEMRMLWRQRLLIVFTLSMIVLTGILLFFLRESAGGIEAQSLVAAGMLERHANTVQWITLFWPLLYAQILLLSGLTVVDVLLRDRQWNVQPVLDSTPLRRSIYLLGKLSGGWLAMALSLTVIIVVAGLLGWWAIGPYEVETYLQMFVAGAVPLAGLHVGLCLLLTAFISSRKLAIGLVLLFSLACTILGTINVRLIDLTVSELLNPGRPYLYRYFWLGWIDRTFATPLGAHVVGVSVSIGLLELAGLGLLAWLWLRWRESRA